jgi:hypothetical protein
MRCHYSIVVFMFDLEMAASCLQNPRACALAEIPDLHSPGGKKKRDTHIFLSVCVRLFSLAAGSHSSSSI